MSDSANKPVLEVRNLAVSLPSGADRAHAVENVSFTVNPGEIVCLVGESGSGKSVIAFTVMGLLAKALKPTSGEILLQGENILTATEERLRELRCTRMSMIFQEPMTALNPVMTCGEQIDEVLQTHTKLDAVARKAKIIGMANGGGDTINTIKQASEFGIVAGGQKLAGIVMFISDIHSLGLKLANGLIITEATQISPVVGLM